jgi:hypothetical protein
MSRGYGLGERSIPAIDAEARRKRTPRYKMSYRRKPLNQGLNQKS